jgi:hypothetical protein
MTDLCPSVIFGLDWNNKIISIQIFASISSLIYRNEGKSAASFCHQVAAWFPDMFCNFYLMKNHKIAKN